MNNSASDHAARFGALPETVYKYRRVDKHALSLIAKGTIYFAPARDFNDPFDTALGFDFEGDDQRKFRYLKGHLKKYRPELDKKARQREAKRALAEVKAAGPERNMVAQELLYQKRLDDHGIFCAAGVRDDLLMWAHYADSHAGICVGLRREVLLREVQHLILQGILVVPYEVKYQDETDRPSFYDLPKVENWPEWVGRLVAVKSTHWQYEKEIRLVTYTGSGLAINCGHDLISEVILGCRISPGDEASVFYTLDEAKSNAVVYRAKTHEKRFALELDNVPRPSVTRALRMRHNQTFSPDELATLTREAFQASGLTQQQVAEQMGVSQPSIAQALTSSRSLAPLRIRIIEAFTPYRVEGPEYRLVKRDKEQA